MTRKHILAALFGLLLLGGALSVYRSTGWAQYTGRTQGMRLDLAHPDMLIRTRSLSSLPRDLLKVPLARDLLTEDFVYYYEEHPDRLGLRGSLRRIAFEHQLQWRDEVVRWILDEPAEVALWRGRDGTLKHWLAVVSRRELTKVLQEAATIAMKDRQLSLVGQMTVDGGKIDLLAFAYSANHTLLILARGDRVLIVSDPGMLLASDNSPQAGAESAVRALLSADPKQQALYRDAFQLPPEFARHSVAVRAHYLSFGYQRFFQGIEALRFDFGDGHWDTQVLFDGGKLTPAALRDRDAWSAMPANPAACALMPMDWKAGESVLSAAPEQDGKKLSALATEFDGPAAVCWYAGGRLHAPLFVATLKRPRDDLTPLFGALFDWSIAGTSGSDDAGALATDAAQPVTHMRSAPRRGPGDQVVWKLEVSVPFGAIDPDGAPKPGLLTVTLARQGRYVMFSPDGSRVEQALATLGKRYPSLAETLPAKAVTLGVITPDALAGLAQKEALVMLPLASEPVLRAAAQERLLPRLAAVKKYPPYRLVLGSAVAPVRRWYALEWQEAAK